MSDYADQVGTLRATVKEWQWEAEKLRRDARELELKAAIIFDRSITLDLIADKIERFAEPAKTEDGQ